ncbi:unnamed protein product [Trichobilharzia regenti]|nr:unnamed protein product [Trichobilharzia regenti]
MSLQTLLYLLITISIHKLMYKLQDVHIGLDKPS